MTGNFIEFYNLEVYKLSRKYSQIAWQIYNSLNWQNRKVLGDQFITSVDSVGANLAEGYGRYHYLDKIKFYYNSRGSLFESRHWFELLHERELINTQNLKELNELYDVLAIKINSFIKAHYNSKNSF